MADSKYKEPGKQRKCCLPGSCEWQLPAASIPYDFKLSVKNPNQNCVVSQEKNWLLAHAGKSGKLGAWCTTHVLFAKSLIGMFAKHSSGKYPCTLNTARCRARFFKLLRVCCFLR
jgi:hypothetical protein